MRSCDVEGDGEAKPGAAEILIARLVDAEERPEHVFAQAGGIPGPSSSTWIGQEALVPQRLDGDILGMDLRIADEIGEAALERVRPQGDDAGRPE